LISAANTETPARANPSAITCNETVFSGSGGAGDEAMAVCKPERQPDRLLTLADEDFLVGIGHLAVGRRHCIASSRASRAQSP